MCGKTTGIVVTTSGTNTGNALSLTVASKSGEPLLSGLCSYSDGEIFTDMRALASVKRS